MSGSILRSLSDLGLYAVTASELEFYLFGSDKKDLTSFWDGVRFDCGAANIPIFNIEKERGHEQYEISLKPSAPDKTAIDTSIIKNIIEHAAKWDDMFADFSAKPLPHDFGSGLHIHIHLENESGVNQFLKKDDMISDALKYSLGGLLLWLPDTMPIFAPHEASYQRFTEGSNGPLNVSWGANNRTVALRLPDSDYHNKRIEHRVAGADADAIKVTQAIIAAIHYGLEHQINPGEQIYGDARREEYNLLKFPASLAEAQKKMQASEFPFKKYGLLMEY